MICHVKERHAAECGCERCEADNRYQQLLVEFGQLSTYLSMLVDEIRTLRSESNR